MAEEYDRLTEHIELHLGPIIGNEPPAMAGSTSGYSLNICQHNEYDMVSVVSDGIRYRWVGSQLPEEFVCTLQGAQRETARFLVNVICEMVVRSNQGLEYDQAVENAQPLVPDTAIHGVLASPHPYLSTDFDLSLDPYGRPRVQLLTLVPITLAEAQYIQQYGADALRRIWEAEETDLLDVYRRSAI
ncbi:hypothetical protein GCM10012275_50250 [Longimycelium tulufanense]|uniref:Suppressor of fused-like domain-containing protein n=1 Tax=Longimycelium tulufanense TaxID=907463 RepID=A0A8J3CG09_9PSEU|nr:suppressor of fused domain protein [Longimycelium tulufanense]GGM73517.1 hypothetical protein GCM10012275_50250 [Longimycelium tulufanense]